MFKVLLAPLAAALIFVTVAPVDAAVIIRPTKKPPTESTSPGDPFDPFGARRGSPSDRSTDPTDLSKIPDNGGGGSGPGIDPTTTASTGGRGGAPACGSDLGKLKPVRANAVRAVGHGDNIDVIPLCIDRTLQGMQRNVEGLRAPISQNTTLTGALRADGYSADRVVGVVINNSMVVLYVH